MHVKQIILVGLSCVDFHETCPEIAANKACHYRLAILSMCPYSCCMCRSCPDETQDQGNLNDMTENNSSELNNVSPHLNDGEQDNMKSDHHNPTDSHWSSAASDDNGQSRRDYDTNDGGKNTGADTEICEDQNTQCTEWANRGDCYNNRETLLITCPKSCGTCRQNPHSDVELDALYDPTTCRDRTDDCQSHADYKTCDTYVMVVSCPKTCNFCAPKEQACMDKHHLCPTWTFQNHCKINPVFMVLNCRLSCGFCF